MSWRSDIELASPTVEYGVLGDGETRNATALATRTYKFYGRGSGWYHHAEMPGLSAATTYRYRVQCPGAGDDGWTAWRQFETRPSGSDAVRLVFTGDFGLGGAGPPVDGPATAEAFAREAAAGADAVWVAGDISYANMHGASQFEATWNAWFDAMEPACSRVPCLVSPGNHETYLPGPLASAVLPAGHTTGQVQAPGEYLTSSDAVEAGADSAWNFTAFDARFAMPSRRSGGSASMWYSVTLGSAHFVSIDTETDFPSAGEAFLNGWGDQMAWLDADLARYRSAQPGGWLIVAGHKPMYSAAPGYTQGGAPTGESRNIMASFEPVFRKYGVDLYLSGHQHGYERSNRVYAGRADAKGAVHIVAAVPGGGCGITADWVDPAPEWSVARWPNGSPWNDQKNATAERQDLGYGVLEANSTTLTWTFLLSGTGAVKDTWTKSRG